MKRSSNKDLPLYDIDSEVPFWRSDINVAALYQTHRQDGAADVIANLFAYADQPDLGDVVLMTGQFLPLLSNEATYHFTFTPGHGDEQAIVFPVLADGAMVDLLAISADDTGMWGCVTGKGAMVGTVAPNKPLRVYKRPCQWLLFECDGVVVLRRDAFASNPFHAEPDGTVSHVQTALPKLASVSMIFAESLDHADDLLWRVFEYPTWAYSHPILTPEMVGQMTDRMVTKGMGKIAIDSERYDIEPEIIGRAVEETLRTMKSEGLFA